MIAEGRDSTIGAYECLRSDSVWLGRQSICEKVSLLHPKREFLGFYITPLRFFGRVWKFKDLRKADIRKAWRKEWPPNSKYPPWLPHIYSFLLSSQELHSKATHRQSSIFPLCYILFTFPVSVTQSKIDEPNGTVIINKQIFRFEVSMDDIELVYVLYSSYNLLEDGACLILWDSKSNLGYLNNPRLTFCIWRYSQRVLHFPYTPWSKIVVLGFRWSRTVGWCWDVWSVSGCGSLWKRAIRRLHRLFSLFKGSWLPLFSLWGCASLILLFRRCPFPVSFLR